MFHTNSHEIVFNPNLNWNFGDFISSNHFSNRFKIVCFGFCLRIHIHMELKYMEMDAHIKTGLICSFLALLTVSVVFQHRCFFDQLLFLFSLSLSLCVRSCVSVLESFVSLLYFSVFVFVVFRLFIYFAFCTTTRIRPSNMNQYSPFMAVYHTTDLNSFSFWLWLDSHDHRYRGVWLVYA